MHWVAFTVLLLLWLMGRNWREIRQHIESALQPLLRRKDADESEWEADPSGHVWPQSGGYRLGGDEDRGPRERAVLGAREGE